jgi:hypothetical protein
VISRGRALVGFALKRGMESGEFRAMDVETTIDVVIAPILMLLIWRHSMSCCQGDRDQSEVVSANTYGSAAPWFAQAEKESQV